MKKTLGILIFVLALFAVCNAGPAFAAQVPALDTPAPIPTGCAGTLSLNGISGKGQVCRTATPQAKIPEPEFMVSPRLKYCTCSCGLACTSDADCGGAVGSCRTGITCC